MKMEGLLTTLVKYPDEKPLNIGTGAPSTNDKMTGLKTVTDKKKDDSWCTKERYCVE
jgi:hypothetical protein